MRPAASDVTVKPERRVSDAVAARLRASILAGELRAGTDLPSERDLSERLGVSRLTLRAALARLQAEGLVRPVRGSGTQILDFRETGGVDLLGHLAAHALAVGRPAVPLLRDVFELRRAVFVELVGMVTERASDAQLDHLERELDVLQSHADRSQGFVQADLAFARHLVRAAGNIALELLFNTFVRTIEDHPEFEAAFQGNRKRVIAVYRRFLNAFRTRDRTRAMRLARRHLDRLDRLTLAQLGSTGDRGRPEAASECG